MASGAMYAGAHGDRFSGELRRRGASIGVFYEPEIEHFDEVILEAHSAHIDICGLDVAMDEPSRVRLGK